MAARRLLRSTAGRTPWPVLLALVACASTREDAAVERAEDTGWYEFAWLRDAPHAPTFRVLDTESSLGPYADRAKVLTLGDLVRMHGHACDGLVLAAAALSVGLDELYPEGVIDRTDTGCITNNSPCFGDVAAYLTGGRIRFGTQKIEPARGASFVVHRFSTGEAVEVELREGLFPPELRALEAQVRDGSFTQEELRACQAAQWEFAAGLLVRPLSESFRTTRLGDFTWTPDPYPLRGPRGDILRREAGGGGPVRAAATGAEGGASFERSATLSPDRPDLPAAARGRHEPVSGVNTNMELGAFSISLAVKDLAASRAFYEKLGFAAVGGDGAHWQILRNGTTTIGLFQGMFEKNVLTFNPGWDAQAQPLERFTDVREIQRRLKAAGLELTTEADESARGPASLALLDPDGNPVLIDQHVE